ncbi:MAG: phosphoesterase [Deltaproteobacteria bacterium]|nr:MAG: phosphoesterase [Deltaproteobacteria bacterium]TMB39389.1 MAG: phosphoesterase [Deltaproteobacteria bacterium]
MTERLYLTDPYLVSFTARVVSGAEQGGKPSALLDRTAFYPEGGGQPGDRGTLGSAQVLDVQESEGNVLHLLDRPLEPGTEVEGRVDWTRRLDHMQQHHGQHLLSAAFERVHGAPTRSFHLGERTCTIDLDISISKLDDAALRSAESTANESVWRNLPVVARDFVGEERNRLPLRKEAVKGDRVILVEGVDASPCGGTHPVRTGDVGAIAVLGVQKWGQGQSRVEFVCGGRVVRLLAEQGRWLKEAADALKTAPRDLPEAVRRTAEESNARRKLSVELERQLARSEAKAMVVESDPDAPIVATVDRASFARAFSGALAEQGAIALIGAVEDGRAHLCFARPKGKGPAMNELLKEVLVVLSGKGGGSPDFAQGSGDPARLEEALSAARAKLFP